MSIVDLEQVNVSWRVRQPIESCYFRTNFDEYIKFKIRDFYCLPKRGIL